MLRGMSTKLVLIMFIVVRGASINATDVSGKNDQEHKEQLAGQEQSDPCNPVVALEENHQSDETSAVKEVCEWPNFSSLFPKDKFSVCCKAIKNGCKIILLGLGATSACLAIFSIVDGAVRLDDISKQPNYTEYINSSPRCAIYDGGYFGHLDPACDAMMESRRNAVFEMVLGGTMSAFVSSVSFLFGTQLCCLSL
jgi:hypothetical protein